MEPLDGARLKVIRAQEHLKSFNEECGRYIRTEPYEVVFQAKGNYIGVKGVVTTEPPPPLACIIGDFVTNLRAGLDYIAWELAMKAGCTLSDSQKRKITFPIAPDKASFSKTDGTASHLARTCGIPAATMKVIESVQPYHAGYESLNSLDLLVKTDKHRMLLLCALFMESAGNVSIYHGDRLCWTASGMSELGMNLDAYAGSGVSTNASDYRMEVNEKPTVYVALKDVAPPGGPGRFAFVGILEDMLKCVANIIPRFETLF